MTRKDPQHRRVWPWVILIFFGLLTTAAGSPGYSALGWLLIAGAVTMIVRAARRNRAAREAVWAASQGRKPAAPPRRPGTWRRTARRMITLLP